MIDELIKHEIKNFGPMSFAKFMQMALYSLNGGYYTTKINKIGKHGDFTTAPEISSLFGYTLAKQIQQVFSLVKQPVILEFGAGSGKLCIDILTALEKQNCLPDIYYILDVSGELQAIQKQFIASKIPHLLNKVKWLKSLPNQALQGVILANEVLDAMPVHKFIKTNTNILESFVTLENSNFKEIFLPTTNKDLEIYVNEFVKHDINNFQSEANLLISHWLASFANIFTKGAVFIIDYGFPAHEYYHPDRNGGTIMCHYQQKANSNPFINIGQQDITAHVNFTHIAESAVKSGFNVAGFTNQASFLINNKILDFLSDLEDVNLIIANQEAKILLQPNEMGELFKVMALTKHLDIDLNGFVYNDKRASL